MTALASRVRDALHHVSGMIARKDQNLAIRCQSAAMLIEQTRKTRPLTPKQVQALKTLADVLGLKDH